MVQRTAWETVARGENALVIAPTGSGKTLAAFLWALDELIFSTQPATGARILYVSPLKALGVDVERNLRAPLTGITATAEARGERPRHIRVGVRSGDTTAAERRALVADPPDILITTPESLYFMLTSAARETLTDVTTVIIDEVHAVAGTKRGAHLALSLERLDALLTTPAQRIGLSATVEPAAEVARFLGGIQPVTVVRPESHKHWDLTVQVPVPDLADLARDLSDDDPQRQHSVWPHIDERVLDLVLTHRSTLIFANSRRTAEQVTDRLNALYAEHCRDLGAGLGDEHPDDGDTGPVLARAHHGSVAKEQRAIVEAALKRGELRCVVATSSLELGIDMGDIDLVIQLAAPYSVASGLQRIGRAGHQVGAASQGVIFPTHRADLVAASVVASRMLDGAIEPVAVVANPLDVLAQHTVAACALGPLAVETWWETVRRSAPFTHLPRSAFDATLDLLAGRYPADAFAELRPRIIWDRAAGNICGRPGAQRLAVTNAGTIPDRGLYPVFLATSDPTHGPRRVGELDEEMVFETRVGDVIVLGTSSWRVEEITAERVTVTPAPGQQGRLPFWHGEDNGRPAVLGEAIGEFLREQDERPDDAALEAAGLNDFARRNLRAYLADECRALGRVPHSRRVIVECCKDSFDDWQLICHSPFGRRVNAPWALAVAGRIRERYGVDAQVMAADDGIVLRLIDADDVPPDVDLFRFDPDELERRVIAEARGSALFASRFRECAGRALMLPNRDPGRRSPLWRQRLRSAQLLQVASNYPDFPIVLEALREVLQDAYDLPALRALHERIASGVVELSGVETMQPSPFAATLLMGYMGQFMYDGDAPLAEHKAAALALDHQLLGELLGTPDLVGLLDADVVAEVTAELQHLTEARRAHDVEGVADLLRVLGPLSAKEVAARLACPKRAGDYLNALISAGRAVELDVAGKRRVAAVEDASRLRDALGVRLPKNLLPVWGEPVEDPLGDVVARYLRTHAPSTVEAVGETLGLGREVVRRELDRLASEGRAVIGKFTAHEVQYVDVEVLRRIRMRSLAVLRAEIQPVDGARYAAFLLEHHHITPTMHLTGDDGLLEVIDQLAGVHLPASAVETLVLQARIDEPVRPLLERLVASGDVLWAGAGTLAAGDGWVTLHLRQSASLTLADPVEMSENPLANAVLAFLKEHGGAFFVEELAAALGHSPEHIDAALAELAWSGHVTSDSWPAVAALVERPLHRQAPTPQPIRSRRGRLRQLRVPMYRSLPGRWFALRREPLDPTWQATELAQLFLDRHGVVTRGAIEREHVPGGFSSVYRVLSALEEHGQVRRGLFVDGLGPAQFAQTEVINALREPRAAETVLLAATDPANPYGAALPWPVPLGDGTQTPSRRAGAVVVLDAGQLVLYLEQGGRSVQVFTEAALTRAVHVLADGVRRGDLPDVSIEQIAGQPAIARDGLAARFRAALLDEGGYTTPKAIRLRR